MKIAILGAALALMLSGCGSLLLGFAGGMGLEAFSGVGGYLAAQPVDAFDETTE